MSGEPADWRAEALAAGRRLFNDGAYFEAHEAFEQAWRHSSGELKLAAQALTQLAAAYHKLETHGPSARGARYLLEKARDKLALHGRALGPGAAALVGSIQAALAELSAGRRPAKPTLALG